MKPNTNDEANIEPCSSEEVEAYRQGYAKAFDDVKKMLNKQRRNCLVDLDSYSFDNLIKCLTYSRRTNETKHLKQRRTRQCRLCR